jgi:uncharacterized protein YndB with AHSA1/START domain
MTGYEARRRINLERIYIASVSDVWDLWTTSEGLELWWGPQGFTTQVLKLDLRAGGELRYAMTATAPAQVAFMKGAGMPLTSEGRVTYTEVTSPTRLGYTHAADFIPGIKPYDVATVMELHVRGDTVRMVLAFEAMHDEEWTQRAAMGMESQLGKLPKIIAARVSRKA